MKKNTPPSTEEPPVIKGFKGFDKDFKCRDKQYAPNTEHEEPEAVICEKGLHFCENPLDVFGYYAPGENSKFAEVEGTGSIDKNTDEDDTKVSVTKLKIGVELSLAQMIEKGIKFIFQRTTLTKESTNTKASFQASNSGYRGAASNSGYRGAASNSGGRGAASNSGDSGAASNSGDSGAASNSGYRGAASNSGDNGAASNSGDRGAASNSGDRGAAFTIGSYSSASTEAKESVAVAVGYSNKAKASLGSWIVVAERNDNLKILNLVSAKVDGTDIKADTFYKCIKGKLIEA